MTRLHSSTYAVECTGITYRRLSWWEMHGCIAPSQSPNGSGSRMGWSDDDIARLLVIASIVKLYGRSSSGQVSTALVAAVWEALEGPRDEWPETLYLWHDTNWRHGRQPGLTTGAFVCVDVVFVLRDAGVAA